MNRLKLDWALSTSTDRTNFVQQYITQETFSKKPLTEEELETISNYILWGKNEEGQNIEQEGLVELPRKNSTWSTKNIDSLDELTESPTFNEKSIYSLTSKLPTKKSREVFSRELTKKLCPSNLLPAFESLWAEIDQTELTINFYDLLHEKRTKPPRAELLKNLDEKTQAYCKEKAEKLNQFTYLKLRHLLVELRSEQYTLKDSFVERIMPHNYNSFTPEEEPPVLDADIAVFPLGVKKDNNIGKLVFKDFSELIPQSFSEDELRAISKFYWMKQKEFSKFTGARRIDFTELEVVYQLFLILEELKEEDEQELYSTLQQFLDTLNYYIGQADLSDIQKEILEKKIKKEKNQDIASYINQKYGKSYTSNYISTIFRQKIIPIINETAQYHKKIVENLFFKEEFKVCTKCGKSLLRDPINFVRKSRAKDGFSNHCKVCDKEARLENKAKGGGK